MGDFRLWWALFVFFGVLSVLAVQHAYRRWRRVRHILPALSGAERAVHERRVRLEAWRLACMAASLVAMTTLVFAALMGAPPAVVAVLRVLAVSGVVGVGILGVRRVG
jgi:hypothetical protein